MSRLSDYFSASKAIAASVVQPVMIAVRPYKALELSLEDWLLLLSLLFPAVQNARYESARLSRDLYDAERLDKIGEIRPTYLAGYELGDFVEDVKEHRQVISRSDHTDKSWDDAVAGFTGGVMRAVDNGGRATLARAAIEDPYGSFARIDPEPPSCAFCTMLISRGPVYSAKEFKKNSFAYHKFDTCILTPVFDEDGDWLGKAQFEAAEELWKKASRMEGNTFKNLEGLVNG